MKPFNCFNQKVVIGLQVLTAFVLMLLPGQGICLAQSRNAGDDKATPEAQVELAARLTVKPNGLSLRPPVGCEVHEVGTGESAILTMTAADHTWRMEMSIVHTASEGISVKEVLSSLITTLSKQPEIISREDNLLINGRPAIRAYVGGYRMGEAEAVVGLTVVAVSPQQFAVLKMITLPPELERAKIVFEKVGRTLDYADPADERQVRESLSRQGQELLDTRAEKVLAALQHSESWFRLYMLNSDGEDKELGYVKLIIDKGMRGDVTGKPREKYSLSEKEEGYTVRLMARYLPADGGVNDVVSTFFLSRDRKNEYWKIVSTYRKDKSANTVSLIGTRQENRILVTLEGGDRQYPPRRLTTPTKGYLSQVELYLLPQILPRREQVFQAGFWYFQETDMVFRTDKIEPDSSSKNTWRLVTTVQGKGGPMETIIDSKGQILAKRTAEGVRWERTDFKSLLNLWKKKGLPTE